MKRIDSVNQLKLEAAYSETAAAAEFFILLKGGFRSSKYISYFPDTNSFDVYHSIHDSWEEDLTEERLSSNTHIVLAIERGAFFKQE